MSADKRVPVTEETRRELHELKEPGQTYDDLLKEPGAATPTAGLGATLPGVGGSGQRRVDALSDV